MAIEIAMQQGFLQEPIQTVYLGGGTPSLLNHGEIDMLFSTIRANFNVLPDAEVTLEANPDDLSPEKLKALRNVGINRLSIGLQSLDDSLLKYLNRAHTADSARRCLHEARDAGFNNISLDLIYAIPGLTDTQWKETVREVLGFNSEHISAYSLTIEAKTVFGNWSRKGKLLPVDEETTATQFELLMDELDKGGYEQYEISNFCRPGFRSKHNSSYWRQSPYLGIGPSAHSYNGSIRQFNVRNNAHYTRSIQQRIVPFELEVLSRENKINEYILTSLRTSWGCDLAYMKNQLDEDLWVRCHPYIQKTCERGLLTLDENVIRLTRKGKLLADKIAEDLMVDIKDS